MYVKWKGYTNLFNSWIDKKHIYSKHHIKVKLDLSNAAKCDLKIKTVIHTSKFANKSDLASLKPDVEKLGIDKLETLHVRLRIH